MRVLRPAPIATAIAVIAFSALLPVGAPAARAGRRDVTWTQRVRAQEAIDRVYYKHLIGATREFEEAYPHAFIDAQVSDYLRKSMALEEYFDTRLTTAMLDAEVQRMAGSSMLPERLEEIFTALRNDPEIIRECLARPILAERLARTRFANSPKRTVDRSVGWDAWWAKTSPDIHDIHFAQFQDEETERRRRGPRPVEMIDTAEGCEPADTWRRIAGDLEPRKLTAHTAVWTGTHMIVWGGDQRDNPIGAGGRYDPATNSWSPVTTLNAPSARYAHVAVWTGSRMLVWGGDGQTLGYRNDGGRYDPILDTWTPMALEEAPAKRYYATAVWTGKEMLVWGGSDNRTLFATGGRYDPATDTWKPMATDLAPEARWFHTAVWTGSRMIVWGGYAGGISPLSGSGGSYDPATDTWSRISGRGAPTARKSHVALWTGDRMLVWGGATDELARRPPADDGGLYDPVTDSWKPLSRVGAPDGRAAVIAVWTGSQMLVWGGAGGSGPGLRERLISGARYSPATDSWAPITPDGAPPGRAQGTGVFIGDGLLIWGGTGSDSSFADGGAFYLSSTPGDRDGDGYSRCRKEDCDDSDPATHRGAVEIRDGRDNDCDGQIAEDDVAPARLAAVLAAVPGGGRPYALPADLLEHFRARYEQIDADSLISSLVETPDGPKGNLSLHGRMTPDNIKPWATPDERARATAMAFLAQEAAILDLPDLGELEERQFRWFRPDVVNIDYVRRIGGYEAAGIYYDLQVGADGPVVNFGASLEPVGPALYAAAKGPFLSEAQVIEIVKHDMETETAEQVTVVVTRRYALPMLGVIIQPASVPFGVSQRCTYGLDAITGEILQKDCNPGRMDGRALGRRPGG